MLTDKQLEDRRKGIGGSDAAAICGLSSYRTPLQVYLEKTGNNQEKLDSPHIYWGNKLESQVAEEYETQTGKELEISEETFFSKENPFMLANIDRKIKYENAILECKTSASYMRNQWGTPGTDQMPTSYLLQCAHYAITLNVDYVDLAVLIDTHDFRIYRYNRNEKLENNLIRKEKQFWEENVIKRIPPSPINLEDALKLWKQSNNGELVTATSIIEQHVEKVKQYIEQIKILEREKDSSELLIKSYLKEAEFLNDSCGRLLISWKGNETTRFDVSSFKKEHEDLYNKFLKKANQRRFLLHVKE